MHRGLLDLVDSRRVAADIAEPQPAAQLVGPAVPAQHPISATGEGVAVVPRGERVRRSEVPVHRGECRADYRPGRPEFLLDAGDAVARGRRDRHAREGRRRGVVGPGSLARRHRRERAQRHPRGEPPGELRGAEDGAVPRIIHEVSAHRAARRAADAPRVEVARPVAAQQLSPLGEEGPLLVEEDLERREIHDRGIGFDLPEVRVHGAVEREVRPESHLHVRARPGAEVLAVVEGVRRLRPPGQSRIARGVREHLEAARRLDAFDAHQLAHPRRPAGAIRRHRHPEHVLAGRRIPVVGVEAPDLHGHVVEAELRERDAHLRRPPQRVHHCFRLPHRVEAGVEVVLIVLRVIPIHAHARRGHAERIRGATVMVGVERDPQVLGLRCIVAPRERRLNLRGVAAVHPRADVERVTVIENRDAHAVAGRGALMRHLLGEVSDPVGVAPDRVVEPSVETDRAGRDAGG